MDIKRISKYTKWMAAACMLILLLMPNLAKAQINSRSYYQVGWQFDFPIHSGFSNNMNDLGLYLDAGYYLTPNISLGGFINITTQNDYIPRQTFTAGTISINTDQVRSVIRIPFGVSLRYRFSWRTRWQPYVSAKFGSNYANIESVQQIYEYNDKSWGFYTSPEIGISIFPFKQKYLGFNLAAYYSYATNHSKVFFGEIDGMNNLGFRVGLTF